MTQKRLKILQLIFAYWHHYQVGPTLEELATQMGIKSRSNIHFAVERMIAQGWLAKTVGEQRSVALTKKGLALCRSQTYVYKPAPEQGKMFIAVATNGTPLAANKVVDESVNPP